MHLAAKPPRPDALFSDGQDVLIKWFRGKIEEWENKGAAVALPKTPRPPTGRNLDEWFDWRLAMQAAGYKCTLRDVAKRTSYAYGTVKQEHMRYGAGKKELTK